jgi:hypothetical protein
MSYAGKTTPNPTPSMTPITTDDLHAEALVGRGRLSSFRLDVGKRDQLSCAFTHRPSRNLLKWANKSFGEAWALNRAGISSFRVKMTTTEGAHIIPFHLSTEECLVIALLVATWQVYSF